MSDIKIAKKNLLYLFTIFFCVILALPVFVHAEGLINTGGCSGIPGADSGDCRNVEILLIQAISLIEYLFGIIGTLAFVMFIYGGLKMIMSFGSEDKFKEGREAMVNAVIGMIIAFSAYILVNFTLDVLGVNKDYRAVGQEPTLDERTFGECSTNTDCSNQHGGSHQYICKEGQCVNGCAQIGGSTCGSWTETSCPAPSRRVAEVCPDGPPDRQPWVCCAPTSTP